MTEKFFDKSKLVNNLTLAQWEAAFRPGIPEFTASTFVFSREAENQVRIAFGNQGPYINESQREQVFTLALTLPASVAVELARTLLEIYANPKDDPQRPVAKF